MDKELIKVDELVNESEKMPSKSKFNLIKFFTGKNLKILILCIISLIAVILFLGIDNNSNTEKSSNDKNIKNEYQTTMQYCSEIENKLEKVLSNIKGAGQVSVMISVEGSPELVYAVDSDTKVSNNSNGSTTTNSSSPIIVQTNGTSTPLILTENLPKVKGVIVVSTGAMDIGIKLDILNAVSTLLDISTEKISVLKGI